MIFYFLSLEAMNCVKLLFSLGSRYALKSIVWEEGVGMGGTQGK